MSSLTLPLPSPARRTAFSQILRNEARLTWRMPVGLIGAIAIPIVLLIIFGELPAMQIRAPEFGGLTGTGACTARSMRNSASTPAWSCATWRRPSSGRIPPSTHPRPRPR